jgi:hypothetical protein
MRKLLRLDGLLLIAPAAAIAPFIVLSFFNHPQNDDYVAAVWTRTLGVLGATIRWYDSWSARYTAVAAMSSILNPLVLGSVGAYKLMVAITILLLILSLYVFLTAFTSHMVGRRDVLVITLFMVALYLLQMPDIAESLYWMACAVCYQYAIILLLLQSALMIRLSRVTTTGQRVLVLLTTMLVVFLTAGTNELAMVLQCEIIVLWIVFGARHQTQAAPARQPSGKGRRPGRPRQPEPPRRAERLRHEPRRWPYREAALLLGASLIACAIVLLAPGTRVRNSYGHHDLPSTLHSVFATGWHYIVHWLTATPVIPLALLFLRAASTRITIRLPFSIHPGASLLVFLATYFGMFVPSFYGANKLETHTVSIIYFVFLLGVFVNTCIVVQYLRGRAGGRVPYPIPDRVVQGRMVPAALWGITLVLALAPASNLRTAYADLLSGSAYHYDRQQEERYALIRECRSLQCDVPALRDRPRSIFWFENAVDEARDDPFFLRYKDNSFAAYFGKRRIRLADVGTRSGSNARSD